MVFGVSQFNGVIYITPVVTAMKFGTKLAITRLV